MCTWEMMLLSALCSYCLRPAKCKFFDLYPGNDVDVSSPSPQHRDNSRVPSFRNHHRHHSDYEPRIAGVMLEPPTSSGRRSPRSITPTDIINTNNNDSDKTTGESRTTSTTTVVAHFDADNFDSLSQI